jgi:hypothetical protein
MTLKHRSSLVRGIGVVSVAACVALAGAGVSFARYGPNPSYCQSYASERARTNSYYSTRGGGLGGAARGAAGGAIIGGITGNAGRGAAIGAGTGAIVGGARRSHSYQYYYDQAYRDCMAGRY